MKIATHRQNLSNSQLYLLQRTPHVDAFSSRLDDEHRFARTLPRDFEQCSFSAVKPGWRRTWPFYFRPTNFLTRYISVPAFYIYTVKHLVQLVLFSIREFILKFIRNYDATFFVLNINTVYCSSIFDIRSLYNFLKVN